MRGPHHLAGCATRLRFGRNVEETVAAVRASFADRGRDEFLWLCGPSTTPHDLEARLRAIGARPDAEDPVWAGMVVGGAASTAGDRGAQGRGASGGPSVRGDHRSRCAGGRSRVRPCPASSGLAGARPRSPRDLRRLHRRRARGVRDSRVPRACRLPQRCCHRPGRAGTRCVPSSRPCSVGRSRPARDADARRAGRRHVEADPRADRLPTGVCEIRVLVDSSETRPE